MAPSIKEALEELSRIDGSPENVASAEILAARVRSVAKAALATFQPDGERREAIARALADKWPGDYMQGDDECEREPNELAYETADLILASGLVQDEAGIRRDEREKFLKIVEPWRSSPSYNFRYVADAIYSSLAALARDGGAET